MTFQEVPIQEEWRIPRLLLMELTKLSLSTLSILYARPNYSMILFLVFAFILIFTLIIFLSV